MFRPSAGLSGEARRLAAGEALVLGNDRCCWTIHEGQVSVYWTRIDGGKPSGQRHHVGLLSAGTMAFAYLPDGLDNEFGFVLSGPGAMVSRVDPASIDPEASLSALGVWAAIMASHGVDSRPLYTATLVAEAGCHGLAAGQTIRIGGTTPRIMRVESGMAVFMGEFTASLEDASGSLVVVDPCWFEAVDDVRLEVRPMEPTDGFSAGDLAAALNRVFAQMVISIAVSDDVTERRRQILRRSVDEEATGTAMSRLAEVIRGGQANPGGTGRLAEVLGIIGKVQGIGFSPGETDGPWSNEHPVEAICRISRVRYRFVRLPALWWKSDAGPILGFVQSGKDLQPVALVRGAAMKYVLHESATGGGEPVDEAVAARLSEQAMVFYRPFPEGAVSLFGLLLFIALGIVTEIRWLVGAGLAMAAFGMALPLLTRYAVDTAIPDGDLAALGTIAMALGLATVCQSGFSVFEKGLIIRLRTLAKVGLQSAVVDRLLSLPAPFFKRYENGELLTRVMMISQVGNMASSTVLFAFFSGVMSASNFVILFQFSGSMALGVVAYAAATAAATMAISLLIRRKSIEVEQSSGKLAGFLVQLIQGVSRLRVAGAGRRAFNQWLERFTGHVGLVGTIRTLEDSERIISMALGQISSVAVLFLAFSVSHSQVATGGKPLSIGSFMAFMAAYGVVVGGISSACHAVVVLMEAFSKMRLVDPILSEPVESPRGNAMVPRLSGGLVVEGLSFRYSEGLPLVVDDVSFRANPGQFIAIVGPSGCGKSTLLRLLLGLEKAAAGSVLFDGRNLDGLDLPSLRRQVGVVMQSPRVAAGSIYDNIAFGNLITMDQAMEAARSAGMAEEIARMPMGMQTLVSEGGANLSGGQRQRLMIARAIAGNPRMVIFDEATSALDNITQEIVRRSLESMKVTRVTVAHRLSTIRRADVIYVMDGGRIVDSGSFEELMGREGLFRSMAARQIA